MKDINNWADDDDVIDPTFLPEPTVTGPDDKGVKTYTSYRIVDGEKQKIVKKVKVVTRKKKVSKKIQERRQWSKFGVSKDAPPGPEEETTIVSRDIVRLEDPGDEAKAAKRQEEEMIERLRASRAKSLFNQRMQEKRAGIESEFSSSPAGDAPKGGGLRTGTALSEMAAQGELPASGNAGGKYVPVHLRGGTSSSAGGAGGSSSLSRMDEGEQNTLRVTNISEDTNEDDLRDLFGQFGRIQRVYLAKDRETQVSRGFAYISYVYRDHAEKAMQKLNGFGYDHLILKVEWAKPSSREDVGSQSVMKAGIVSGYGGALPQGLGN